MTEFVFTISPRSLSPKFARVEDDCNKLRRSDINEAKRQSRQGYMKWYRRGKQKKRGISQGYEETRMIDS